METVCHIPAQKGGEAMSDIVRVIIACLSLGFQVFKYIRRNKNENRPPDKE